jgi:hypothetical protein
MKIYSLDSVARPASDEKERIFIVDRMLQAKFSGHPRSRSSAKESYRYRARYNRRSLDYCYTHASFPDSSWSRVYHIMEILSCCC